MTNDAFEAMLRRQAKPMDTKGSYEQKLAAVLDNLPERRRAGWSVRRMGAAVLAAAMLLACATGIAMSGLGFFDFWNGEREEAEGLIEKGIVQSGGVLENAEFTVREAVFDGNMIQVVVAVRGKDNALPVAEDSDLWYRMRDAQTLEEAGFGAEKSEALIAGADVIEVNGQAVDGGSYQEAYEEDGTLVFFIRHALPVEDKHDAQVVMRCYTVTPDLETQEGKITFTLACAQPAMIESGEAADMGALTITKLHAAYTALGVDIELTYMPGERLKKARPTFVLIDGEEKVYWNQADRTLNADGTYTMRMRFDKPKSLPGKLVVGVEGLDKTAVYEEDVK